MDAKQFGTFLASVRKERNLTQSELGQKLHVTDKAVSRWERGVGLPDIHLLEPLADALGISVLELMQSERIEQEPISSTEASEAIVDAIDLAQDQQKKREQEQEMILKILFASFVLTTVIFLLNQVQSNLGLFMVILFIPEVCATAALILLVYGAYRAFELLPWKRTVITGVLLFLVPVLRIIVLFISAEIGWTPAIA